MRASKEYTEEETQQILYEYHDAPAGGCIMNDKKNKIAT